MKDCREHWSTKDHMEIKGTDTMQIVVEGLLKSGYDVLVRYSSYSQEELGYPVYIIYYHYSDIEWDGCRFALVDEYGREATGEEEE